MKAEKIAQLVMLASLIWESSLGKVRVMQLPACPSPSATLSPWEGQILFCDTSVRIRAEIPSTHLKFTSVAAYICYPSAGSVEM